MPPVILRLLKSSLDLLAPARCAGCGRHGDELCGSCAVSITAKTSIERFSDVRIVALGAYEGIVRRAIHALKYGNRPGLGSTLGKSLANRILSTLGDGQRTIVVPVPLHLTRLRERGYNQAELIARAFADLHEPGALVRARATAAQAQLDRLDRERNVAGAFATGSRAARVVGKNVLIVDDVVTTGATVRACAGVLRAAGATSVMAAAIALRL